MLKKILFFIAVLAGMTHFNVRADEGMWLPLFIDRLNYVDMQKMGLQLTAEEIYSVNHSSLKDAIIQFGNGCTGAVISKEGLIITNHHCGYSAIQANSTVEHDYLTNGFWALDKKDELPYDMLTVTFLVRIEDVTQKILSKISDTMTEVQRTAKIDELITAIKADAIKGTDYEASVKSFFDGNEYYLFVYEIYEDIRLVGAPPESIGGFGGDTDNWTWPRHTGDFSIFRVYTGPDGKPASYSKDNIPLVPKYSLPISVSGYKTNDFTMVLGYPGSTDRFLTSYGVKLALEQSNPSIVKIREKKLAIMKSDMDESAEVRIKYASKYATTANYWKFFIGQSKGLIRLDIYDQKKTIEETFEKWIATKEEYKTKYGDALINIAGAYTELSKYTKTRYYFTEGLLRGCEIISFAGKFESLYNEYIKETPDTSKISKALKTLKAYSVKFFKDYNAPTDQKLIAAMLELFYNDVSSDFHPDIFPVISKKYKKNFEKYSSEIFAKSIFTSIDKVNAFLAMPDKKTLANDMAFKLMLSVMKKYKEVAAKITEANILLSKGNRSFIVGLREMYPDKKFYPNANSTMRMSYGKVLDYYPADAIQYGFFTTLDGVMEKEDSTNVEFIVPSKLEQLWKSKDYGKYADADGKMHVCFLTDNDITGGNSGSPILDGKGQLIGLAFDGNWEAMINNIAYDHDLQRTINVDIRYVLFVIDKYAGASNLIKEMNITDSKTADTKTKTN
ncbi:MAG: S46 family peptidase [Bacteroidota bacterium]